MAWIRFGVHVDPFRRFAPSRFNAAAISGNEAPVAESWKMFRTTSASRLSTTHPLPFRRRARSVTVKAGGGLRPARNYHIDKELNHCKWQSSGLSMVFAGNYRAGLVCNRSR